MAIYKLYAEGIKCGVCAGKIQDKLNTELQKIFPHQKKPPFLKRLFFKKDELTPLPFDISVNKQVVTVDLHKEPNIPNDQVLPLLLNQLSLWKAVESNETLPPPKPRIYWDLIKGIIGLSTGAALLIGSYFPVIPPLLYLGAGISTLLTFVLGGQAYVNALKMFFFGRGTLNMNSLFMVSTLVALGVSLTALFFPLLGLPMMFNVPLLTFGFSALGQAFKKSAEEKVRGATFSESIPNAIEVLNQPSDEKGEFKPKTDIKKETIIIVRKGQIIPADGKCLEINTAINESRITGNIFPRTLKKGDDLYQGMVVPDHVDFMRVQVTKPCHESYLSRMDKELSNAENKIPTVLGSDKIFQYFVPLVFAAAITTAVITSFFFPLAVVANITTLLFVCACPCILGLARELATLIGLKKAAKNGVRFKDGQKLQALTNVDTFVFDLNGTVTLGQPKVAYLKTKPQQNVNKLLAYSLALEEKSKHPIAKAIYAASQKFFSKKKAIHCELSDYDDTHHSGLKATINGEAFAVGNEEMMNAEHINLQDYPDYPLSNLKAGQKVIYLALDKKIAGHFVVEDPPRPGTKAVFDQIRAMGKKKNKDIEFHFLSGDHESTVLRFAKEFGVPAKNIKAQCKNAAVKIAYIKDLQAQGRNVAMVGDAGNDSGALKQSNVGFAVQSPSMDMVSQEAAGAVISGDSLQPIVTALHVAHETMSHIKKSLSFSLVYNAAAMIIPTIIVVGLGIPLNPAWGVLLMFGLSSLFLINAYRIKQKKIPPAPTVKEESASQSVFPKNLRSINPTNEVTLPLAASRPEKNNIYLNVNSGLARSRPTTNDTNAIPAVIARRENNTLAYDNPFRDKAFKNTSCTYRIKSAFRPATSEKKIPTPQAPSPKNDTSTLPYDNPFRDKAFKNTSCTYRIKSAFRPTTSVKKTPTNQVPSPKNDTSTLPYDNPFRGKAFKNTSCTYWPKLAFRATTSEKKIPTNQVPSPKKDTSTLPYDNPFRGKVFKK